MFKTLIVILFCWSLCCSVVLASLEGCSEPKEVGRCRTSIPRYFYNTATCQCEEFNWGGCGGNSNNYLSKEDCLSSCKGFGTCDTNPRQCYLPEDPGPCKALKERFHYDPLECKCKKFNYGGCQGNDNNFDSYGKCMNTCGKATCPICNLPKEPGLCKAKLTRWYFDAADCQCKTFIYGGCGGNINRFLTKNDCKGSCGSYPCSVCTLPKVVGPCKAAIERWYYNPQKKRCRRFSWGGCKPNGNNFRSKKLCNKMCKDFKLVIE